jgi:hypothetical protein
MGRKHLRRRHASVAMPVATFWGRSARLTSSGGLDLLDLADRCADGPTLAQSRPLAPAHRDAPVHVWARIRAFVRSLVAGVPERMGSLAVQ